MSSAHNNRGTALLELKRHEEACASLQRAAQLQPADPSVWVNLCAALRGLRRFDEALASADRALALNPRLPEALTNRALRE